jgi:hypothetical protein
MSEEILKTIVTDNGVVNITPAVIATEAFRRHGVALVRALDPATYEKYKATKRPNGQIATEATRRAAYQVVMQRAAELAVAHYVRIE